MLAALSARGRLWLVVLMLVSAVSPPADALEPFLTGTESDAELARDAEDRDWQVGDVAATAALHAEKGWTYFNKKHDVRSAMRQFDKSLELWPNTVLAVIGKAYCLDAIGRKAEAVTLLSSCQCKDQITPDVVTLTEIDLLIELKRYEDALAACDKLRDEIPRAYIGSFYPNYNNLIPRAKVLVAMGKKADATLIANKIYSFGVNNPHAKAEALKIYKRCGTAPPATQSDTSAAKAEVHEILKQLLADDHWTDLQTFEKILGHKFTTCSVNGREAFGFDDRSDNLIASAALVMKNADSEMPSLTVNLNFPLSLVSFRELKQWFPGGVTHPSYLQGCLAHSAFWELNQDRNHLVVQGGDHDSDIVCRLTLTRK